MARILVTGCAGFIGSHLCDALIEAGHEVIGIDNLSTGKIENINSYVDFYEVDIRNTTVKELFKGVDYVYHLAALARIQPSIDNPKEAHDVNLTGTLNILEACRKHKIKKILFSSSSAIYDDTILPFKEAGPIDLKNPYSAQKYMCEQYIRLYKRLYDLDYVIFRYFNVYGPRQILEGAYAAVVGIFLKQRREGKPLTIVGSGEQRRDFTHVYDVVNANILGMKSYGTFNIGTGKNLSVNELAQLISDNVTFVPPLQGEAKTTLADNSRATEILGWKPKFTLTSEVIEEMDK